MDGGWLSKPEYLEDHGIIPRTLHYLTTGTLQIEDASFVEFTDTAMRDLFQEDLASHNPLLGEGLARVPSLDRATKIHVGEGPFCSFFSSMWII